MKRLISIFFFVFISANLAACDQMTHQDVGTVAGAVAGGLLGSTVGQGGGQMVAIMAGTLAGAYLGGAIGHDMDEIDRMRMREALEYNDVGVPAYWRNRRTHCHYEVVPVRNVRFRGNAYCREYRTIATIGGKRREIYGTACRQPDGSWRAVS